MCNLLLFSDRHTRSSLLFAMNLNDAFVEDDDSRLNPLETKKKCHGNRSDQRFRRKWRERGMDQGAIEELLKRRKENTDKHNRRDDYISGVTDDVIGQGSDRLQQRTTVNSHLSKRKRDASLQELQSHATIPKSTSSLSMSQPVAKKMKEGSKAVLPRIEEMTNTTNKNYRSVCLLLFISNNMPTILDDRCTWNERPRCFLKR